MNKNPVFFKETGFNISICELPYFRIKRTTSDYTDFKYKSAKK